MSASGRRRSVRPYSAPPEESHGEMAFVQHMVASLADGGRMAVVLPNGCFFRGGAEQDGAEGSDRRGPD
jgi:type I restriction enzyme M protein